MRASSACWAALFAWAISSVPASRKQSTPPTWSTWPWVSTMARSGPRSTASKFRLWTGASKPIPVLTTTRPAGVTTR